MCIFVDKQITMNMVNDKECKKNKKVFVFYKRVNIINGEIRSPFSSNYKWTIGWNYPSSPNQTRSTLEIRTDCIKYRCSNRFVTLGLFAYTEEAYEFRNRHNFGYSFLRVHAYASDILGANDTEVFVRNFFVTKTDYERCLKNKR